MTGFLYLVPRELAITKEMRRLTGLADKIDKMGELTSRSDPCQSPENRPSRLYGLNLSGTRLLYKPAEQTWVKAYNGKYWIGVWNDQKPGPEDLRRKRQLSGHLVELDDGREWLIPVARSFEVGSVLPQRMILTKEGTVEFEEIAKYAGFSARVQRLWEEMRRRGEDGRRKPQMSIEEQMQVAHEALMWNYQLGTEEINLLGILTTELLGTILAAIIDYPTYKRMLAELKEGQKKTMMKGG